MICLIYTLECWHCGRKAQEQRQVIPLGERFATHPPVIPNGWEIHGGELLCPWHAPKAARLAA